MQACLLSPNGGFGVLKGWDKLEVSIVLLLRRHHLRGVTLYAVFVHANVDRIFTMWQIIHNDTYVTPTAAVSGSESWRDRVRHEVLCRDKSDLGPFPKFRHQAKRTMPCFTTAKAFSCNAAPCMRHEHVLIPYGSAFSLPPSATSRK
ncbi:hypothetical protein F4802DRAFT_142540 [Xylaria palmicola]|nr:hypothetical protein F4802DRAFT_142540 [Xylaria palmicola]